MIVAGLPLESWILVGAAVGIGLAIEIAFFVAHRRRHHSGGRTAPGGEPPSRPGPSEPAP